MDCVTLFREALQGTFGLLDWLPIPDSSIRRFHVPGDKPRSENGWYILYPDGIASGAFGSWKHGQSHRWSSREPANPFEADQLRQRIEQARRQREAEQHQRQQSAAEYANRLWRDARRADPAHAYLGAKQIRPHHLRQHGDALLVPLTRDGVVVNLQRIYSDGSKSFLSGGMVTGCCALLGTVTAGQPLYVCEGWATGVSIHTSTGHAVACAMNAGNLLPAGQRLQRQNPDAVLIIGGDDDRMTDGNPGRAAANYAAAVLGCDVVFPPFPSDAPQPLTDFNDLANWRAAQ